MTHQPRPPALKRHHATKQPPAADEIGTPIRQPAEGAARKGVLSACGSDPHRGDGSRPLAWLHIVAPRGAVPTGTSWCAGGRDRSAIGHRRVLALISDRRAHHDGCPLHTTTQEGRAAA